MISPVPTVEDHEGQRRPAERPFLEDVISNADPTVLTRSAATTPVATRPRVVVVGYNTFQPLLYQVATGGLNPGDVTYALRAYASRYRNTTFRRAAVTGVDPVAHLVHLDEGSPLPYDYLIVSTGVATNYFGIPGAAAHSITIYTRAGAIAARDRVLTALERAQLVGLELLRVHVDAALCASER